jgi:hypothetical protein
MFRIYLLILHMSCAKRLRIYFTSFSFDRISKSIDSHLNSVNQQCRHSWDFSFDMRMITSSSHLFTQSWRLTDSFVNIFDYQRQANKSMNEQDPELCYSNLNVNFDLEMKHSQKTLQSRSNIFLNRRVWWYRTWTLRR